ncbi:MAG: hypothetical protein ACXABY_36270, partial [Candidatus Thorarchaeota archaeon]
MPRTYRPTPTKRKTEEETVPLPRISTKPRPVPIIKAPPTPSPAFEGLREREPVFNKLAALDVVNQETNRWIQNFLGETGIRDFTQLLSRAFTGGIYEFPKLFGGEAFVPQPGRPPFGVSRERYLRATQEPGSAPSRLMMGAPTGRFTQEDLPTTENPAYMRSFVRYGKLLMSGLMRKRRAGALDDSEALYDPGEYYFSGAGAGDGGGGTIRIVRGGGSPGSQA